MQCSDRGIYYEHNDSDLLPLGVPARIITVGGNGALRCRLLDMGLTREHKFRLKVAPLRSYCDKPVVAAK